MWIMDNGGKRGRRGFTLVELLVVIAIIAILSAILVPAVRKAMESARRVRGSNNIRQVAMAFMNYSSGFSGELRTVPSTATTAFAWAETLANTGGLNDAGVYLWNDDPALKGVTVPKVVKGTSSTHSGAWAKPSVVMLSNVDPYAPATTTPIAWSRGLNLNTGQWSSNGIYGSEGGFMAFLDGHVEWLETTANKLVDSAGSTCTSPIVAATHGGMTPVATTDGTAAE